MRSTLLYLFIFQAILVAAQDEQLIVFTQAGDHLFTESILPQIKDFTTDEEIQLFEFEATDGIPNNITSTPAIIYRNGNGVSTYAGRYTSMSTIKNFIRSSRVIPQTNAILEKENVFVNMEGNMKIAADIKITPIKKAEGIIDSITAKTDFHNLAIAGIERGLGDFLKMKSVLLQRTDRIFYLDFHPYFEDSTNLILSFELYSQFSCIDPIYKSNEQKIKGSNFTEVFERASTILKEEVHKALRSSTIGDAYNPIPISLFNKDIREFNIPVPENKKTIYSDVDSKRPMPKEWMVAAPVNTKLPILQFNFMEPLSRYAGEVKEISGNIKLDKNNKLVNGTFQAIMKSLTMGEESFDKKVLKSYVKAKSNPRSNFKVISIVNSKSLNWLETTSLTIEGEMTLLKKTRPITVTANLTPYVNENGKEAMMIQANWSMNITDNWGIAGPDGPDPAKKTLDFSMNLLMNAIQ